jgi:subtilisin family serine protease
MVWGSSNYSTANNSGKYAIVIDTGVSRNTGDLNYTGQYSKNFTSTKTTDYIDYNGHGTHVAGTIGAVNDADGVVGVAAGANIISVRVLDKSGSGTLSGVIQGIQYAASLVKTGGPLSTVAIGSLVANMSLGGGLNSTLDNAVRAAATADTNGRYLRIAIAAGNSGADVDNFSPANTGDHQNIYTVSAVNSSNIMASWSNYDNVGDTIDDVDFSAPGVSVVSLGMTAGTLATLSGTSMAAPHMAGVLLMGTPLAGPLSTPVLPGASGDPFVKLS